MSEPLAVERKQRKGVCVCECHDLSLGVAHQTNGGATILPCPECGDYFALVPVPAEGPSLRAEGYWRCGTFGTFQAPEDDSAPPDCCIGGIGNDGTMGCGWVTVVREV